MKLQTQSQNQNNESYDPLKDEPYMNSRHLSYFKDMLNDWKIKHKTKMGEIQNQLDELNSGGFSGDELDRFSIESDMSFLLSQMQQSAKMVQEIESSLNDIENGKYGFCHKTGAKIGLKRLIFQPTSKYSVKSQKQFDETEDDSDYDLFSPKELENQESE